MDRFYNQKFVESARRLKGLQAKYGASGAPTIDRLSHDEATDLLGALLDLRNVLRKLQWFGEVNRRGFVKITKKLDKKVPTHGQHAYVEGAVAIKPFATNTELMKLMNTTNAWVAKLGTSSKHETNGDARSGASLTRVSSKSLLDLSNEVLDALDKALRKDEAAALDRELDGVKRNMTDPQDGSFPTFILDLLQRAILYKSRKCIAGLLNRTASLEDKDDINQRNCLHRYLVSLGRNKAPSSTLSSGGSEASTEDMANGDFIIPAATPVLSDPRKTAEVDSSTFPGKEDESVKLFEFLLDHLTQEQREALVARDQYGRLPLHYAAQYGFVDLVKMILSRMQGWEQFEIQHGVDAPFWQDHDNMSPLGLSIVGAHAVTTEAILESERWRHQSGEDASLKTRMGRSGEALALATKCNFVPAVQLLIEAGVDINYQDTSGESALHVAARLGHEKCAELLLSSSSAEKVSTELFEATFGWTPLFLACVEGHMNVVQLLINSHADLNKVDTSGWMAKEHACLRGHMDIVRALAELTPKPKASRPESPSHDSRRPGHAGQEQVAPAVKSFGHRYLTDASMVLVRLGSADARTSLPVVSLNRIPLADAHRTQLDTALSLVIHAAGASGEPFVADLPAQENEPIAFTTRDPASVKLYFDLVPTYAGSREPVLGRGVAMLGSIRPSIGDSKSGLRGDVTVPVVAAQGLEVLGEVRFNFQIVTPFKHKNLEITEKTTYWKKMTSTTIIGHRGSGKNQQTRRSLQLGENTIQSFIAAANLGASYVEFDVQLTKDRVPVIYHDFLVSETGIDAPMHTLTLEQFHHISQSRSSRPNRSDSPERDPTPNPKGRSLSLGHADATSGGPDAMNERMKYTYDFKKKGFKANSRGSTIQAPFATLAELFDKLAPDIGFNIECKYPMLHEAEEHGMDAYAVELNAFADAVLAAVFDRLAGTQRAVLFSSFNPDLCVLFALKQPSIPILFLTDAGCDACVADVRASSLQEAVRFASRWNLLGIVSAAEPLVRCPRLVRAVKESGLVCVSYGTLNNDWDNVRVSRSMLRNGRLGWAMF